MARPTLRELLSKGASLVEAMWGSATNPDGTAYTLPVSGTVTATPTGAPNINAGQATAGAASGELVPARATRRGVTLRNTDAANSVWIGEGVVSSANGFLLKAGESVAINTTAAVNGIRDTADVVVAILEEYD